MGSKGANKGFDYNLIKVLDAIKSGHAKQSIAFLFKAEIGTEKSLNKDVQACANKKRLTVDGIERCQ
jgi:hypothetical protein